MLVAMEHMNSWLIACATTNYAYDIVIKLVKDEIIVQFGPPERIVSDNEKAFIAASVQSFIKKHGVEWSAVFLYAPMANERAKGMVRTIKHAIKRSFVENRGD